MLNYFLADDSVEVKESVKQNSGKDPFPLLLHRGKLPKVPIMTHYPVFYYFFEFLKGMTLKKEEYYSPEDLKCGDHVVIYGRNCLIYDCDDFTKDWYLKK